MFYYNERELQREQVAWVGNWNPLSSLYCANHITKFFFFRFVRMCQILLKSLLMTYKNVMWCFTKCKNRIFILHFNS